MMDRILLVDDEANVLQGYVRNLRKHFDVSVALGGQAAIRALEEHPDFAVLITDMRMPGLSGLEVLKEAQVLAPTTVRLMLTGNSDQRTAMDAVNDGQVFRFLTKPIEPEDLRHAILAAVRQHHLQRSERVLLDQTLKGCFQVLSDVLSTWDPEAMGRAAVVRLRSLELGQELGLADLWPLEMASLLAPFGYLSLPRALADKVYRGEELSPRESAMVELVPLRAGGILGPVPRMEGVSEILRLQGRGFDGSGVPTDGPKGRELPLESRILRAISDLTYLEYERKSLPVAAGELRLHPKPYDPEILERLLTRYAHALPRPESPILLSDLHPGMVLSRSLLHRDGRLILLVGQPLSAVHLEILKVLSEGQDLQEPFFIRS